MADTTFRHSHLMKRLALIALSLGGMLAGGASWQLWATERDARRYLPPGSLIAVDGPRRLHLHCEGTGQPTVILEASGLGNSRSYDAVLPKIAQRTRVCAYDRAGMGWSDPQTTPLGFADLEADLEHLLSAANQPPKYLLVSSSAGGLIAQRFASRHADEVTGLVLLDSPSTEAITRAPSAFEALARDACLGKWAARFGLLRLFDPLGLRKTAGQPPTLSEALTYKTAPWDATCALTRDFLSEAASAPPLPREVPLLVLSHDEPRGLLPPGHEEEARRLEPLWQETQANLARQSDKGNYRKVRHSGHLIAHDQPDAVVAAVFELLDELGVRH